jgi:hypothetical protein
MTHIAKSPFPDHHLAFSRFPDFSQTLVFTLKTGPITLVLTLDKANFE